MKRALETVNFVRSAKVVFGVFGFIFGVTLIVIALTHTQTVGLFQKDADPLWPVAGYGATLLGFTALLYVVLSWMEQTLLALVMIATDPANSKPNLVLNTGQGYRFAPGQYGDKTADERFAADAEQAMKIGNDK